MKGGERAGTDVSSPFHPCRSTGTASNPNSYYCLCKLRVRNHLSREIAVEAGAAGRGWAEESLVCTGVWGESCWDRELTLSEVTPHWPQTQLLLQLSCHSQWLQGMMVKLPWKNPNCGGEAKTTAFYYYFPMYSVNLHWGVSSNNLMCAKTSSSALSNLMSY